MTIQVVGAGVGRTGTHSLKLALEQLTGGRCHHMVEMFGNEAQIAGWSAAMRGEPTDWVALLADYRAIVDFPGALFWREMAAAFPDAVVLLSVRPAADWYRSARDTIFNGLAIDGLDPWLDTVRQAMADRFSDRFDDEAAMIEAFERHNAAVRAEIAPERLVEWTPSDGWGPLCAALGVAVPAEPFPLTNTTEEFRSRHGLDGPLRA